MLYDPGRHEPLVTLRWNDSEARAAIERIVVDTEARFTEDRYWPLHPLDWGGRGEHDHIETSLYNGACGVFWALHYLEARSVVGLARSYASELERLLAHTRVQ